LLTFQTTAIRNFGVFTALGIVSALVIEMTLIPAVRVLLPDPGERERSRERSRHLFDRVTERLAALVTRAPRRVLVGAVLIAAVAATSIPAVRVDSSFRQQFLDSALVRRDDAALNAAFGGTSTLVLLVDGGAEGAIDEPAMLAALSRVQAWLEQQPEVGKTLSVVDFVGRMHFALGGQGVAANRAVPDDRDLVTQYWLLYSLSGGADDFEAIVDTAHRTTALRAFLHDDRTETAADLISRLQDVLVRELPSGAGVEISGSLASGYAMNEVMVRGKIRNVIQIALLIFVVSALVLRSLLAGVLVALPLAFAVLTNFAAMALFDVPLDIGTSAISAMAVGIGADYAIYFLFRLREERASGLALEEGTQRALATSGKAILFVSSAIAAGYSTLCFSGFGYHVRLGALVAFAMVVSSLASLTVLPAAVLYLRPRFLGVEAGGETLPSTASR